MKLFAVYMGGKHAGSRIEAHDVIFVVAERVRDAAARLQEAWFGVKSTAHIDSWVELTHVENLEVTLSNEKSKRGDAKIYFVNIGFSVQGQFGEQHAFHFLVARTKIEAKEKARVLFVNEKSAHVDDICDIDAIVAIDQVDGWHVRLVESVNSARLGPLKVNNVYWPLWRLLKD